MARTILTYDNLTLHSSELLTFNISSEFAITRQGTVNDREITQPGNVRPLEINITAKVSENGMDKMINWRDKPLSKPLYNLILFDLNWGGYYLTNVEINTNELDDVGKILRFKMAIVFLQNISF